MNKTKTGTSWVKYGLALATFAGVGLAGYKYLDADAMLEAWNKFTWDVWGVLLILPAFYLLAKSIRFALLMRPVTEADPKQVLAGYAASQGASLLPGGVAMRAAMMHRVGVPVEESSGPILANSASDQALLLGAGLVLCYYYPTFRTSAFAITGILILLLLATSIEPSRALLKHLSVKLMSKFGLEDRLKAFFQKVSKLWDFGLWAKVMIWTALANATSVAILCLVVHALGYPVEPWPLTAAFVIPGLIGRLSPFPAGAGVTEAGMIGFLAAQTALSLNVAAVATIIFRVVDIVLPAIYGGICQLFFLKHTSEVRTEAA